MQCLKRELTSHCSWRSLGMVFMAPNFTHSIFDPWLCTETLWIRDKVCINTFLHTIAEQFFLNLNFCFLFLVQYFLETCVNCVANCGTQQFTPMRSEFRKLFYGNFRQFFNKSRSILQKTVFSKIEFLFSVLGSMMSRNMCELRHTCKNVKNLPKPTWSWQNKPWCMYQWVKLKLDFFL